MSDLHPPVNEHDHIQGNSAAPLTLVEYADFQCPYCGDAYAIVQELQQRLGDQLRFVFREFPLTDIHEHALHAAQVAEAAAAQDQFWPMHDYLFEHQRALDDRHLMSYAQKLGLDMDKFSTAIDNAAGLKHIQTNLESGERSGVRGTPTFFINGELFQGEWDVAGLLAALEEQMSR